MTNGLEACAGWNSAKQFFVNKANVPWKWLKSYHWIDDWLCTHAGLTNAFFVSYNYKNLTVTQFLDDLIKNPPHRLKQCSDYRGGRDAHSGIFWCDYDEFDDIPMVKQIFGHTHGELRCTRDHICIDTWLKYYAIYDTNTKKMRVKKNNE